MMNSGRHVCTEVGDCKVATTAAQANATVMRPCSAEQEREAIEKARAEAEAFGALHKSTGAHAHTADTASQSPLLPCKSFTKEKARLEEEARQRQEVLCWDHA